MMMYNPFLFILKSNAMKSQDFDPNVFDLQDEELCESFFKLGFDNTAEFTAYFRSGMPTMDLDDSFGQVQGSSSPRIRASF
jgi:hypothetical protein